MGSKYSLAVVRDVTLEQVRQACDQVGLKVEADPIPLADGWWGSIAQVGPDVVAIGPPPWHGPVDGSLVFHLAETLRTEACLIAASSVVSYYRWLVIDAAGDVVREWETDASGDTVEEYSKGVPLPEESGLGGLLDEAVIEECLERRTGVCVRSLPRDSQVYRLHAPAGGQRQR